MKSLDILRNYIESELPMACKNDGAEYIKEMTGEPIDKVHRFLKGRSLSSAVDYNHERETGGARERVFISGSTSSGATLSEEKLELMCKISGLDINEVLEMYYYWYRYRIEEGLTDNEFFVKIYPTPESFVEAVDYEADEF